MYTPPPLDFFPFPGPATPAIYPLSLHDALPICDGGGRRTALDQVRVVLDALAGVPARGNHGDDELVDRKSTRLNSSHVAISYAVFCLKKKKKHKIRMIIISIKKQYYRLLTRLKI